MSSSPRVVGLLLAALCAGFAQAQVTTADAPRFGFGRTPTAQEIAGWDIDVRPDGHGLRPGRGSVAQGQVVYDAQCASCHGTFGESNRYMALAGGVRRGDLEAGRAAALRESDGVRTLGTKLNHATTLWDYIYRAMPWANPQSLTVDETYAVTAYVLHLNDILPADFILSDGNIRAVRMPNRNGMTLAHGMRSVQGKPDAQGSLCMRDCAALVSIASEMPAYARNQHGNLAEQMRPFGPVRGIDTSRYGAGPPATVVAAGAPAAVSGMALATQFACTACHGMQDKVVGPGFAEIARRYQARPDAQSYLADRIRQGGQGVWGAVPMPPQAAVSDADARALAGWILAGAPP